MTKINNSLNVICETLVASDDADLVYLTKDFVGYEQHNLEYFKADILQKTSKELTGS